MRKKLILSVFEILILVFATIAFSYITGEIFGESNLVSAQSSNEFSDEEITALRETYNKVNPGMSDEEVVTQTETLIEGGYLERDEVSDPTKVEDAFREAGEDFRRETQKDEPVGSGNILIDIFGWLLPTAAEVATKPVNIDILSQSGGLEICPETIEGKICQSYPGNVCEDVCSTKCIELEKTSRGLEIPEGECSIGYCFDAAQGTCLPGSSKGACETGGLEWFDYEDESKVNECKNGCCLLGDEPFFVSANQCEIKATERGMVLGEEGAGFDASIIDEPSCIVRGLEAQNERKMGACVTTTFEGKECVFETGGECDARNGEFHLEKLCSNPSLETECEKQASASCVEGRDEIFWKDSCGNIENIYEGSSEMQKNSAWNNGDVKKKEDSCVVGDTDDPLKNQATCGNCNHFFSSICGEKNDKEKLSDSSIDAVCRNTACEDESGKRRENGESWCAYQSQIGLWGPDVPGIDSLFREAIPNPLKPWIGGVHGTDTPGSSHFRQTCLNGEIKTETCESGRKELCVETRSQKGESNEEFSQASCIENRAMECYEYNPGNIEARAMGLAGQQNAWRILQAKLQLTCGLDSQCFVKNVFTSSTAFLGGGDSTDTFKFSFCAPRYKPGFDRDNPEEGKAICAQASQKCTAVFVKGITGWDCKANCHCIEGNDPSSAKPSRAFVQEMNDFCMSLGDCGNSVNYKGDVPSGPGYSVRKTKGDGNWLGDLTAGIIPQGGLESLFNFPTNFGDAEPTPGEYIDANNTIFSEATNGINDFLGENGILEAFGTIDKAINGLISDGGGEDRGRPKVPSDYTGGLTNVGLVAGGAGAVVLAGTWLGAANIAGTTSVTLTHAFTAFPAATGFGGALAGAGIGVAAVGFLIDVLGIGAGLGRGATYALMAGGGIGGGMIGYGAVAQGGFANAGSIGWLGVYVFAAVVIIIIIFAAIGVGDIVELNIEFQCKPWEPPRGGSREKCGACGQDKLSDGSNEFPCNEYACESLGWDCVFVSDSEGENGGICEYSPNDDVVAPVIVDIDEDSLGEGFSYEKNEDNVFEIIKDDGNEGCVDQYESVNFTFELDEYARECRVSGNADAKYEDMFPIGASGRNITYTFNSQLVDLLSVEEFDVEEVNDVYLYFACEDLRGNKKEANDRAIKLCVVPEDHTAPLVSVSGHEQVVRYDAESHEFAININEPADCRWDYKEVSYEQMENEIDCQDKSCGAEIELSGDVTDAYVLCRDRPEWVGTDRENERNTNTQSVKITIRKSESALEIVDLEPEGDVYVVGRAGKTIEIELETDGGADGNADCAYTLNDFSDLMKETGGRVHSQIIGEGNAALREGFYELGVRCEDLAGNVASKETNFTIEVDSINPKITRVYIEGGNFYIVTDEDAECGFVNELRGNSCDFIVGDGNSTLMGTAYSEMKLHSTAYDRNKNYYVKCADIYENSEEFECEKFRGGVYAQ